MGDDVDARWLRRFHPGPEGSPLLICFPHAGAGASYFHSLSGRLAGALQPLAVQYPGRQDRRREPAARSIPELADRIGEALGGAGAARPVALLGHSLGALVAYEVARRLEERAGTRPLVLFASGRRAPSIHRPETVTGDDGDASLMTELRRVGGPDQSLFAEPELLEMALPALRADYAMLRHYRDAPERPALGLPITALTGDRDPVTSEDDARAWERHTTGAFELAVFPGGHFFLTDEPAGPAATIIGRVRALVENLADRTSPGSP
jgi:pyochelin biosynthesis protein PchC